MSAKEKEPIKLKLPVFLPDDYDGLYSVAQALAKRFMELYAENKELKAKIDKLVEGQQAKTIAGSGGKVNDGTIR